MEQGHRLLSPGPRSRSQERQRQLQPRLCPGDAGGWTAAVASYRKALDLAPKNPWIRTSLHFAQRAASLEPKLPAYVKGDLRPHSNDERLALAKLCRSRQHYAFAARLYVDAFSADPSAANDLDAGHRYSAICCATLAAAGKGNDADLAPTERLRWRRQGLTWLRAHLGVFTKEVLSSKSADRANGQSELYWMQVDPNFALLRDEAALKKMPAEERQACKRFWADVATLLKKAQATR